MLSARGHRLLRKDTKKGRRGFSLLTMMLALAVTAGAPAAAPAALASPPTVRRPAPTPSRSALPDRVRLLAAPSIWGRRFVRQTSQTIPCALTGCYPSSMRRTLLRLVIAFGIGSALVAAASLLQPRFVAGSIPDGICELILMPGKLLAVPFRDRGTASPEFLWRSRTFASIALSVVTFFVLPGKWTSRRAISG